MAIALELVLSCTHWRCSTNTQQSDFSLDQWRIQGWGIQGTFLPSPSPSPVVTHRLYIIYELPPCTSGLPFVQKMQKMHKISGDLAIISMISDERTIIFCLGIVVIHQEMPKVGVVDHLHMRIVHNLVKFPPPLVALIHPCRS